MPVAEKVSLNSQVLGGSVSLKIYITKRDLYQQTKPSINVMQWNFQEVFLIMLSLFANLKLMSASYS